MRIRRAVIIAIPVLLWSTLALWSPVEGLAQKDSAASIGRTQVTATHATVWLENGVAMARARMVAAEVDRLWAQVGGDLVDTPPQLKVRLYASHASFARALYAAQHARPQSSTDNTSEVVDDTLLLGPVASSYLQHNLAHVYTEWIVDRLTGNRTAVLPSTPWLYDGIAEYEAFRYDPAGLRCSLKGPPVLDITIVRTARQWLSIRSGPLGDLEYCLAYLQTRALIARIGWSSIQHDLHQGWSWNEVARHLLVTKTATSS